MALEFTRPLIFVAHPDDETLACGGLLQRMPSTAVVFATDGAAPHYGFERKFGTLKKYAEARFKEAALALAHVPNFSFQRLMKHDGSHFVDEHLFHHLREAAHSLCAIARAWSPDALLSHSYEGGHIDHDACSFIARHAAAALSIPCFEFPLYYDGPEGKSIFQQFRDPGPQPLEWQLTEAEIACKRKMLAAYKTQPSLESVFQLATERIRPAHQTNFSVAPCRKYPYENRWRRLPSRALLKKFAEFTG